MRSTNTPAKIGRKASTSMADDQVLIENTEHTVGFSRKVNLEARGGHKYENAEASFFLKFTTPPDAATSEIIEKAMEAFVACQGVVLTQLGIEYDLDAEGVIVEKMPEPIARPQAAPQDAVTQVRNAFGGGEVEHDSNVIQGGFGADVDPRTLDKAAQRAWAKARYQTHPQEFWDNRPKKASGEYKPNASDFSHKTFKIGFWLK
jgi:hypothetical protein